MMTASMVATMTTTTEHEQVRVGDTGSQWIVPLRANLASVLHPMWR